MVTALNDLNAVLYDILQSEKQSLASSKKECKKGRPGQTGKPSKGKKGNKPSKKKSSESGMSQGKKPGKKGVSRKPAEEGKTPGEQGKGTKELLKEIDNKLNGLKELGDGLQSQKLEELKDNFYLAHPMRTKVKVSLKTDYGKALIQNFKRKNKDRSVRLMLGTSLVLRLGQRLLLNLQTIP